jgi:hypothetical protein
MFSISLKRPLMASRPIATEPLCSHYLDQLLPVRFSEEFRDGETFHKSGSNQSFFLSSFSPPSFFLFLCLSRGSSKAAAAVKPKVHYATQALVRLQPDQHQAPCTEAAPRYKASTFVSLTLSLSLRLCDPSPSPTSTRSASSALYRGCSSIQSFYIVSLTLSLFLFHDGLLLHCTLATMCIPASTFRPFDLIKTPLVSMISSSPCGSLPLTCTPPRKCNNIVRIGKINFDRSDGLY